MALIVQILTQVSLSELFSLSLLPVSLVVAFEKVAIEQVATDRAIARVAIGREEAQVERPEVNYTYMKGQRSRLSKRS
jgi:hypothetical protein